MARARGMVFLLDALLAIVLLASMMASITQAGNARTPSIIDSALASDALAVLDEKNTLQTMNSTLIERELDRCLWGSGLTYNATISVSFPGGNQTPIIIIEGNGTGRAAHVSRNFTIFNQSRVGYLGVAELWVWK